MLLMKMNQKGKHISVKVSLSLLFLTETVKSCSFCFWLQILSLSNITLTLNQILTDLQPTLQSATPSTGGGWNALERAVLMITFSSFDNMKKKIC